jgi:hypothetical protein
LECSSIRNDEERKERGDEEGMKEEDVKEMLRRSIEEDINTNGLEIWKFLTQHGYTTPQIIDFITYMLVVIREKHPNTYYAIIAMSKICEVRKQ